MRDFEQWKQELMTGGRERVYRNERLRSVAMPLGGIGAGTIALAGDGSLRQWQIFNVANHLAMVPDSFFAVWAKAGDAEPVARVLQSSALYDEEFPPVPSVNDYIVPEESKRLLKELPGVEATEFVGEYPIAEVAYKDDSLPVEVSLQAFSPFVPLNSKDSGLPAIIFRFSLHNPCNVLLKASIAAALQNAAGYDGLGDIHGTSFSGYGGNRNEVIRDNGCTLIVMDNPDLPEYSPTAGTMVLGTLSDDATALAAWDDLQAFWTDFASDGVLANIETSKPSPRGKTFNSALAVPVELAPGETRQITFIYTWHFPNHYVNWKQDWLGVADKKSLFWIGNAYCGWFGNAREVVDYVIYNFDRLVDETLLFRSTFYDSTLPYWFLDCISSQISTIRSPTCLWNEDGKFHAFEGCHGASTSWQRTGGCCPLNCTHVWNYEMTLSRLFPDLERTMRETDLVAQLLDDGEIPHRTVLPTYLPRWKEGVAADGQCGTVLKTCREYLLSGDKDFLAGLWPRVKRAMAYAMTRWDSDEDGVMDGAQWNTYDCNVYGRNSFITGLYLAALLAAEKMALIMDEPELVQQYHNRFEAGKRNLDDETFDGDYYIQIYDENEHQEMQYGRGCLSDQFIGQWWAHILGLGYILPPEHVKSTLRSIYQNNFRHDFKGFEQQRIYASPHDMGLLNCTWPKGGRPAKKAIDYADEVWTGVEYEVAGLMIHEGLVDEGLQIVKAARDRYDGTERNPWNEVECGDHYARPMSSWYLLESISGWHYDASQAAITVSPKLYGNGFKAFFITSGGWGTFSEQRASDSQIETLTLAWGSLQINQFNFTFHKNKRPNAVEVKIDGKPADVNWDYEAENINITFKIPITIQTNQQLTIKVN
ncbi:MAG TPA: GH116 family glycosyl-hydrolase [Armatimonadota bacterium]|nr:GH116 family glycosyl-hydrolase [Armatimonadota bacterium]